MEKEQRTANIGLPQWGVKCFYETFVGKRTAVHLLNISAKNPPLRQAAKRWLLYFRTLQNFDT